MSKHFIIKMKLKVLLCELIKNARPQALGSEEEGLHADQPFELVGYGEQMGHYWRLARFDDQDSFYIEDFGDFHYIGRLDIDAITNIKAWTVSWDNVYYNHKGEKIILSVTYEDGQFDFTEYNKYSNEDGESILERL